MQMHNLVSIGKGEPNFGRRDRVPKLNSGGTLNVRKDKTRDIVTAFFLLVKNGIPF